MRYLGDYVETPHYTRDGGTAPMRGRVTDVHAHGCPQEDWWLQAQELLGADPMRFKNERWVTVLSHDEHGYDERGYAQAGAICVPDRDEFVQRVEPFKFAHRDAELYFPKEV